MPETDILKKLSLSLSLSLFLFISLLNLGTVFAQEVEETPYNICINGIISDGRNSLAVIDGEHYRRGDMVKGFKIIGIEGSRLKLQYGENVLYKEIGDGCSAKLPVAAVQKIEKTRTAVTQKLTKNKPGFSGCPFKIDPKVQKFLNSRIYLRPGAVLFTVIILYVYFCFCLQVIGKKTATQNSWMAWLPLLNLFLICAVARRSFWWVVLLLVPWVNIIILVYLWAAVAGMRRKPKWIGFFMILPAFNIIALGYLAFSR